MWLVVVIGLSELASIIILDMSRALPLFLLCTYALIIRYIFIQPNVVAFLFDHGKDSLAVIDMIKTGTPKLIGPWTSIPGVFFGPAWYYLLAPGFLLTNGQPMSGVYTLILLSVLGVVLAYKYLGKVEAVLVAASLPWIGLSSSAWNPYPIAYTMMLVLIGITKVVERKKLTWQISCLIGLSASLGFHFSTAYAIFYLFTLPIILIYWHQVKKIQLPLKSLLAGIFAFFLPFIPQLIFELRHNFLEFRSAITYLTTPTVNRASVSPVSLFLQMFGEMRNTLIPNFGFSWLEPLNLIFSLAVFGSIIWVFVVKRKLPIIWFELFVLTVIPLLGLSRTHFNIWYLTPLLVIYIMIIGHTLKYLPQYVSNIYLGIMLVSSVIYGLSMYQSYRPSLLTRRDFLPTKERIINYIYQESKGEPFAVYHYLPEIYDFGYQYLYFAKAMAGYPLPVEFSYRPGETSYIPEKSGLLAKFPTSNSKPKLIFYVVENPDHQTYLDEWWAFQHYSKLINTYQAGSNVTVYSATP
jgi:hypothetical protein